MTLKYRVREHEECSRAFFRHCREGAVEFVRTSSLQELKLHSQRPGRDVHLSYRELLGRIGRVREDRHPTDCGRDFLEQLQLLAGSVHSGHPCDVPARACEVCAQTEANRIACVCYHNGDRLGRVLGCQGGLRRRHDDDVHLETNQLGGKVGHRVRPTLSKTSVDGDVLPFNPPELAQPFAERLKEMWVTSRRGVRKITDPVYLPGLLRLRRERRGEEGQAEAPSEHGEGLAQWTA